MSIYRMPITNIDGINIRYGKEHHLPNHFDIAVQTRLLLHLNTFTIWNEGVDHNYSYQVQNLGGLWRVHTRQVWITDKIFKNIFDSIYDLTNESPKRRYFS